MLQLIHTKDYNKQQIEEKINNNENMDYTVRSLAISLINQIKSGNLKYMTIDSNYNKIRIDVDNGAYHINVELGDSIEFESTDGSLIRKFKLIK